MDEAGELHTAMSKNQGEYLSKEGIENKKSNDDSQYRTDFAPRCHKQDTNEEDAENAHGQRMRRIVNRQFLGQCRDIDRHDTSNNHQHQVQYLQKFMLMVIVVKANEQDRNNERQMNGFLGNA